MIKVVTKPRKWSVDDVICIGKRKIKVTPGCLRFDFRPSPAPSLLVLNSLAFPMADLTMLHAPSTLYLPEHSETGLRFTFNRRSLPPRPLFPTTPMVTVEMADIDTPPSSPVTAQDENHLSPHCRSFISKQSRRVAPRRPSSAPPGSFSGKSTLIDSPDHCLSPHPKTPDPVFGRPSSTPALVRPPTTLCACIVTFELLRGA